MNDDHEQEAAMRALDRIESGLIDLLDDIHVVSNHSDSQQVRDRARVVLMHIRLFALPHDEKEAR
jgi:hypothetical protein